mmetsp:Transcript_22404/g.29047  ORF Transcript_22404/g.29047 Transcript_22404/m.29047 type:complete len:306 (-) Transcript_22404:231-1148(-)
MLAGRGTTNVKNGESSEFGANPLASPMLKEEYRRTPCLCPCCDCKLSIWQFLFLILLGTIFALVCIDLMTTEYIITWIEELTDWLEDQNIIIMFGVMVGLCVLFCLFCTPATVLALASGYLFSVDLGTTLGVIMGTFVVTFGCTLGASLTFFMSRYMLRDCGEDWISRHQYMQGVDLVLKEKGAKMNFLLRLTPVIPMNVCNWLIPVTSTRYVDYLIGCSGMIPWFLVCDYFGSMISAATELSDQYDTWSTGEIVVYVIGGVCLVITFVIIIQWTRKVIDAEVDSAASSRQSSIVGNGEKQFESV